jgi:tRNA(fMet)-specific endonuclease VapC
MRYLIDTTVLIPYFAGDPQAEALIKQLIPDGIAVSILSYLEAYQGAIEEADPEAAKRQFNAFFTGIPVLPVSPAVARRCAEIRSHIKSQGKSIRRRAFDLVIAATALEHGLEVVTHNTQDFQDIPNLVRYQI